MMTATEYIYDEINRLVSEFPHVRVRYEYRPNSEVHFVEVMPSDVYHLDEKYAAWEIKAISNFIDLFPTQNICFISDDALVGIRNAEYILEGLAYAPLSVKSPSVIAMPGVVTMAQTYTPALGDAITLVGKNKKESFLDYTIRPSNGYQLVA